MGKIHNFTSHTSQIEELQRQIAEKEETIINERLSKRQIIDEYSSKLSEVETELNHLQKDYDLLIAKYSEPINEEDTTLSNNGNLNFEFYTHNRDTRESLIKKLITANKKLDKKDQKIKELQKQLRKAESKRYDSYVPEDKVSYYQLLERVESLEEQLKHESLLNEKFIKLFTSLSEKINSLSIPDEEKANYLGQIIDGKKKAKPKSQKMGRPPIDKEKDSLVMNLHEQGKSQRAIAEELNISPASVNRIIKRYK